ncbi:hypothetical protein BJX62DRAFT_217031 [Aspergillus germanicus]
MFLCSQPLITVLSTQYITFNLTVILMSEEAFSEPHCSQEPAGHLLSCHGEPTRYAALAARSPSPAVISIQNDLHEAIATSEFEIRHQYTEPSFLVSTKSKAKCQEIVQRTKASKLRREECWRVKMSQGRLSQSSSLKMLSSIMNGNPHWPRRRVLTA